MVTDIRQPVLAETPLSRQGSGRAARSPHPRIVFRWTWILAILTVVLLVAIVLWGGQFLGKSDARQADPKLTYTVQPGELLISVTEDGTLESARNVDIKCQVAGGSTILWIVADGTEVKEGEDLVRLDASKIEEEISQQQIAYEQARSTLIQAESDFAVAEISVEEYVEGTYPKELQLVQSNVAIAQENLRVAQRAMEYSEKMHRKGYISSLELDAKGFAVEHAQLELDMQRMEEQVLKRFTRAKTLQDLESKLKAAKAKVESDKAALALEEARLNRLKAQRDGCTITAPADGMVIYPQTESWRQEPQVQEGSQVREQQTLIQLPDLTRMQVKVKVHESKVDLVKPGMRARIRIQDDEFQGEVLSVANRAEQTGWWSSSTKEFATIVTIDNQGDLRPGKSAEVEILIERHKDVLSLPVAAVIEQQGSFYCWVKNGGATQRRPLKLGPSNDQFIVVNDGVRAGEKVILNPMAMIDEARQGVREPLQERSADEKYGAPAASAIDSGRSDHGEGKQV